MTPAQPTEPSLRPRGLGLGAARLRGALIGAVVVLALAAVVVGRSRHDTGGPAESPGAVRIGSAGEVRSAAELAARARDPRSSGKTYLVRGGHYGRVDLQGARQRRTVTFRRYPGERALLGETTMANTSGIRLEGLRFDGGIGIQGGTNERIQIVHNDLGGFIGAGIDLRERSRDILIKANHIHDLRQVDSVWDSGYGLRVSSPNVAISGLRIIANRFERFGNDAMEIGGVDGLLLRDNEVSGVNIQPGSTAHSDPLFIWAGARNVNVRGNSFHDNSQPVYLQGGIAQVVFENNVVARSKNYCMQVGGDGRGGDGHIRGLVMRDNTIWDCGFGGILFSAGGRSWTLEDNIIQSVEAGPPEGTFGRQGHNLIQRGPRRETDFGGRPRFLNPARADYFLRPGSPAVGARP